MSAAFLHQACVYGSDDEFLAMAVPFIEDGLKLGQRVLVTTTAANLELLHDQMGSDANGIDYAESAYFGRRPPQRSTAFYRYWSRNRSAVRILAEPIWTGRSRREVAAWKRMEAGLNVVLADTDIWMICPYDARILDSDILADARRTHPECVVGRHSTSSPDFVAPEQFAISCRTDLLPERVIDPVELFGFDGDLGALRQFVIGRAAQLDLSDERTAMFSIAVGEAITYLLKLDIDQVGVRIHSLAGQVVCSLRTDRPHGGHPFLGFRPPQLREEPGDGLWLTHQICEWVDIRSDDAGSTIELAMPGPHAEEALQTDTVRLPFGG